MKRWYQSRTIWIALIQAIIGIITIFTDNFPSSEYVGGLLIAKSFLDIANRLITDTKIG